MNAQITQTSFQLSESERYVLWLLLNEVFSPSPCGLDKRIMSILTTQDFYRARLEQAREKLSVVVLGGRA